MDDIISKTDEMLDKFYKDTGIWPPGRSMPRAMCGGESEFSVRCRALEIWQKHEKLQSENKKLKEARQDRSTEFAQTLDILGQAAGMQISRGRWWDTTREEKIKLLLSKIKALRYNKP